MLNRIVFLFKIHKEHLKSVGYHDNIWSRDHYIQVQIDDRKNLEENYRLALVGCYGEYVDILTSLDVGNKVN